MNNNRGGNNRRRGRGNNNGSSNGRPQGANGGPQVNRIDSRARGNAPQMLEKYRKLANDAHLNGDRVNAEYYLQFADHYFRVIADTRVRQEEQRLRRDDRWQEGDSDRDDGDDLGEYGLETEFAAFDQPPVYTRREREDRPERTERAPERVAPERVAPERAAPERAAPERAERHDRAQSQAEPRRRDERPAYDAQGPRRNGWNQPPVTPAAQAIEAAANADGGAETAPETVTAYEPPENPFLRENRGGRGLRPRREDRRPRGENHREDRGEDRPEAAAVDEPQDGNRADRAISAGIDPESLPPSFTAARAEPERVADERVDEEAPTPAPRRRARRKTVVDDAGEPMKSLI